MATTKIRFSYDTIVSWCSGGSTRSHFLQNKKYTRWVHFLFWWERVESNHLSLRQQIYSLPRLSDSGARPKLLPQFVVRAEGIEPSFQAWKACILAFELCSLRFRRLVDYIVFFYNCKHLFNLQVLANFSLFQHWQFVFSLP